MLTRNIEVESWLANLMIGYIKPFEKERLLIILSKKFAFHIQLNKFKNKIAKIVKFKADYLVNHKDFVTRV